MDEGDDIVIEKVIQHLHGVKRTGPGRYMARCPSHDDKTASMTISETEDGRVLMHCFAGCSIEEILGTVGLEFQDLYPEPEVVSYPERSPISAKEAFEAISFELTVIGIVAADLRKGKAVSDEDYSRFLTAINRVQVARDMVCR